MAEIKQKTTKEEACGLEAQEEEGGATKTATIDLDAKFVRNLNIEIISATLDMMQVIYNHSKATTIQEITLQILI